jgi:hypothetical protein
MPCDSSSKARVGRLVRKHGGGADVAATQAYLIQKIPLFSKVIQTPGIVLRFVTMEGLTITFDGCRMTLKSLRKDEFREYVLDFKSTEPSTTVTSSNGPVYRAVIFQSGYHDAISYRDGYGPKIEQSVVEQVEFVTHDAETAQRLSRAFNNMRTLCDAQAEPDPFASR